MNYSTKNWIIGILAGGWIASTILGLLHSKNLLNENIHPLLHTTRDWFFYIVVMLPIAYSLAKSLPSSKDK